MPKKEIKIQGADGLGIQTVGEIVVTNKGLPGIVIKPQAPTYPDVPKK